VKSELKKVIIIRAHVHATVDFDFVSSKARKNLTQAAYSVIILFIDHHLSVAWVKDEFFLGRKHFIIAGHLFYKYELL